MVKVIISIIGIAAVIAAIMVLRAGTYPTSGLMLLSVGIITLIVAAVIKNKRPTNSGAS